MKVQDVLTDESKWCQGACAIDSYGRRVLPESSEAVKFCLKGALMRVGKEPIHNYEILNAIVQRGYTCSITGFNDSANFNEVRKLIEDLDI